MDPYLAYSQGIVFSCVRTFQVIYRHRFGIAMIHDPCWASISISVPTTQGQTLSSCQYQGVMYRHGWLCCVVPLRRRH
jgi:hypothetical protein